MYHLFVTSYMNIPFMCYVIYEGTQSADCDKKLPRIFYLFASQETSQKDFICLLRKNLLRNLFFKENRWRHVFLLVCSARERIIAQSFVLI